MKAGATSISTSPASLALFDNVYIADRTEGREREATVPDPAYNAGSGTSAMGPNPASAPALLEFGSMLSVAVVAPED